MLNELWRSTNPITQHKWAEGVGQAIATVFESNSLFLAMDRPSFPDLYAILQQPALHALSARHQGSN